MFGCVRSECHGCSQGVKFSIWHLRSQWMRRRTSCSATQKQSAVLWMKFRLLWTFVTYPLFVYFLYRYCLHVQIWWDVVYNLYRLWFSCIELMRHCIYYRSLTHAMLWGIGVGIWWSVLNMHGMAMYKGCCEHWLALSGEWPIVYGWFIVSSLPRVAHSSGFVTSGMWCFITESGICRHSRNDIISDSTNYMISIYNKHNKQLVTILKCGKYA